MKDCMENKKLSKNAKKVIKKQRRAQATLYKHDSIPTVDYETEVS